MPAGQGIRIIEAGSDSSGCDAGEELLGAYCYSTPPGSVSASGVSFRKDATGKMTGDVKLQAEGKLDKAAGQVQSAVGKVKDDARKELKN